MTLNKNVRDSLLLFVFLLLNYTVYAQAIYSTPSGGLWTDPTTWVGGIVPIGVNDVVLDGTVYVDVRSLSCKSLIVNQNASLLNDASGNYDLYVFGDVTNYGNIEDNTTNGLFLNIMGDIYQYGTFSNFKVNFFGALDQHLFSGSGDPFNWDILKVRKSFGKVVVRDTITFNQTEFDLQGITLQIDSNAHVRFIDMPVKNGIIEGDNHSVYSSSGTYYQDIVLRNCTLKGFFQPSQNVTLEGQIIVEGTLRNYLANTLSIDVNGDLVNNGTISDHWGQTLTIEINGNLTNKGTWNNYQIILEQNNNQIITQYNGSHFSPQLLTSFKVGGSLHSGSSIGFINTEIDLALIDFHLSAGHTLTLQGSSFKRANVFGNKGEILSDANSFLEELSLYNIQLSGLTQLSSSVVFKDSLWINGTVQNKDDLVAITTIVEGPCINNGVIQDSDTSRFLIMSFYNNLKNNGSIRNLSIDFTGQTAQVISQGDNGLYQPAYCTVFNSAQMVFVGSSLDFLGTSLELFNSTMVLAQHCDINLHGGNIRNGTLLASGNTINFSGNAYLESLSVDSVILQGNALLGTGVTFNTSLTINDSLQGYSGPQSVNISGNLVNNGWVGDLNGNNLDMTVSGDITQNGELAIQLLTLDGTSDQMIKLVNNKGIASPVTMNSNIFGANFAWLYDNAAMPGKIAQTLSLTDISKADYGIYQCSSSNATSRQIIVEGEAACTGKDGFESNDTKTTAAPLFGGAISGFGNMTLCPKGDIDWFWYEVTDSGKDLQITLDNLPRNYQLSLYDNNGLLTQSLNDGSQQEIITVNNVAPGMYYVKVEGWRDAWSPEAYDLNVKLLAPAPIGGLSTKPAITGQIFTKNTSIDQNVSMYPNPASEQINLEYDTKVDNEEVGIKVMDAFGRVILQNTYESQVGYNRLQLSLNSIPSGNYFLILKQGSRLTTKKLIIAH